MYDYRKSQQIKLVYVAMSRVTSIEGLYITNSRNDFKFYHGLGCDSSTVREMRNEYLRLERHPLNTLTKRVELFMNCSDSLIEDDTIVIFFVGMNAQSLVAQKLDFETDPVLTRADFLMVSETWITNDESVQLENYMMEDNIIELSQSPYTSPIVAIPKKDGKVRICLDAREINKMNVNDRTSPGEIEEILKKFHGTKYISARDTVCGYWQVELHPNSKMCIRDRS